MVQRQSVGLVSAEKHGT